MWMSLQQWFEGNMATPDVILPQIALVGAGIFVRTQYIPRLREIAAHVIIKAIWSRSEVCYSFHGNTGFFFFSTMIL